MNSFEMRNAGFLDSVVALQCEKERPDYPEKLRARRSAIQKEAYQRKKASKVEKPPVDPNSRAGRSVAYATLIRAQQATGKAAVKAWAVDLKSRGWKGRIGSLTQGGSTFSAYEYPSPGVVRMHLHTRGDGKMEVTCTPGEVARVSAAMLAPTWRWPEGITPMCDNEDYKWTADAQEAYQPEKTRQCIEETLASMGWKREDPNSVRFTNGVRTVDVRTENYAHQDEVTVAARLRRLVSGG